MSTKISARAAAALLDGTEILGVIQGGADKRCTISALGAGSGFVSVKDPAYGATGNGTTDDTTALQAAITANYGKTLFIPAGNYKISTALSVVKPINLLGEASNRLNDVEYGTRIFTNGSINLMNLVCVSSGDNDEGGGRIDNINFDGNNVGLTGLELSGVGTTKWHFERLRFTSCLTYGTLLSANHTFVFISCRWFYNGGGNATTGGVKIDGANAVMFYSCSSEANNGSGLLYSAGQDVLWEGGAIEGNDYHGIHGTGTGRFLTVRETDFETNNIAAAANIRDINISATGNTYWTIENCAFTGTGTEYYIYNNAQHNNIRNFWGNTANKLLWSNGGGGAAYNGVLECVPGTDLASGSYIGLGILRNSSPLGWGYSTPAVPATGAYPSRVHTNIRIHILTVGSVTAYDLYDPAQTQVIFSSAPVAGQVIDYPAESLMSFTYAGAAPTWKWFEY